MILINLQKAFDTIDHDIVREKLYAAKHSVNWFQSYLINRKFLVNLGNVNCQPPCVSKGEPQGSLLGPLHFLIYIKDISQAAKCNLFLYDWFVDNKLSIHFGDDKTKYILFATKFKI